MLVDKRSEPADLDGAAAAVACRGVGVSYSYGTLRALSDVDIEVRAGTAVGLLGVNGAGKTTLLQLLIGRRRPSRGRVELFGGDPVRPQQRARLGVTLQETGLPDTLRVGEVVDFVAAHFHHPEPTDTVLARFGLAALRRRQAGGLSGGQRRRLAVALAFVGRPELVVLDEPTTGLDVESRRAVWDAVAEFRSRGGTVLLTSHDLGEVEELSERVVVLSGGRVIADDSVEAIRRSIPRSRVRFTSSAPPDLPGAGTRVVDGHRVEIRTPDAESLVRDLVASGAPFQDLSVEAVSLEDAFLELTARGGASRRDLSQEPRS